MTRKYTLLVPETMSLILAIQSMNTQKKHLHGLRILKKKRLYILMCFMRRFMQEAEVIL